MSRTRLARREAILEVARDMLIEHGFDAITVRDLAKACGVSVPTLYNQFGGKDALLAAAIENHFVDGSNPVPVNESQAGLERVQAIVEVATLRLLETSEENRSLLQAFSSLESSQQVQQRIGQRMVDYFVIELRYMREKRQLVDWIDLTVLAGQITTAFISTTTIWGSGAIEDEDLLASTRYATSLVLLGVVRGRFKNYLEEQLKAAQLQVGEASSSEPAKLNTTYS